MENQYRDVVSLYPRNLSYNSLAKQHVKLMMDRTYGKTQNTTRIEIYECVMKYYKACKDGKLDVVKGLDNWLEDNTCTKSDFVDYEDAFRIACENGHLEIARWIYEIGSFEIWIDEHMETFEIVCKNGYFEIAKWLWECTIFDVNPDRAFCKASEMGHLDIVRFIVSQKPERYQLGENNESIIIKFNFPKTQADCLICYDNKTCYQVSCCHKEMCRECLEQIEDTRCPHCRDPNCL